jgi:hypothetical protein
MLWRTLKNTVHLTRLYLENPTTNSGYRQTIHDLNGIINNNVVESRHLIPYMVITAFTSHEDQQFFRDMAKIRDILQEDKRGRFKEFRGTVGSSAVGFDRLMGAIGQNRKEDPFRFDFFVQTADHEAEVADAWREAFVDHAAAEQRLQSRYEGYRRSGRWLGYAATAGTFGVTYLGELLFGHFIWGVLPPDLQIAGAGVFAGFVHDRLSSWIRRRIDKNFSQWSPDEINAVRETYKRLLEIDPKRTIPFLAATAEGRANDEHRIKPLESIALDLLVKTKGPRADQALFDLGIHSLKDGDATRARRIFDEVARRNPLNMGEAWQQVSHALTQAKDFGGVLTQLTRRSFFWKAAVALPVGLGGVVLALQHMTSSELSLAVTAIRDVFVLSAGVYGVRRLSHILDERPMAVAQNDGVEKLYAAFLKLSELGPHGTEILSALAENKIPGELGAVISEAAKRVLSDLDDVAAPHKMRELAMTRSGKHKPEEAARLVNRAVKRQGDYRGQLCRMDFATIGKH